MTCYLTRLMPIVLALFIFILQQTGPTSIAAQTIQKNALVFEGKIDRNKDVVLGGVPKECFKTGILYQFRPVESRHIASLHNGEKFRTPLTHRQWRQTIFELDKNKLYNEILPDSLTHMRRAGEYRWQYNYDNRQPLILADVNFEWLDRPLSEYPNLYQIPGKGYILKKGTSSTIKARKDRFFCAGLVSETVFSRLVTFSFEKKFIYTNSTDPISTIVMDVGGEVFVLSHGGKKTVDLGEKTGIETAQLTATHVSGRQSRTKLVFQLKKLPSGKWTNTVIKNGQPEFASTRLPVIRIQRPEYLKQLTGGN